MRNAAFFSLLGALLLCSGYRGLAAETNPVVNPEERAKEIDRLLSLPMGSCQASAADGDTLGDEIEKLAVSANMSYDALPSGALRSTTVTFRIFDRAYNVLLYLARAYNFDMFYESVGGGRGVWRFTPIRPDELITRAYVLKNNNHEVTTSSGYSDSGSSNSFSSNGYNGNAQQMSPQPTNGAASGTGSGLYFNSSNPLAQQLQKYVAPATSGGPAGFVEWISDSNTFLVRTTAKQHQDIADFLDLMDQPVPQIQLDVVFVLSTLTDSLDAGVDFSFLDNGIPLSLSGLSTTVDLNNIKNTRWPSQAVLSTADLTVKLNALAQKKQSVSVITGSQTVLSNRDVTLDSVQEYPIQQNALAQLGSSSSTGSATVGQTTFKDIGTSVKAHVKAIGDEVDIALDISVSNVVDFQNVGGQSIPISAKQHYTTQVKIEKGLSLAMGGLESSIRTDSLKKIPLLGDIPFFGFPFRNISRPSTRTRLLMFVTPHILPRHSGGNFGKETRVAPVLPNPSRSVFAAKPGLSLRDVESSLVGMSDEIEGLELEVKSGRGDQHVRQRGKLLVNELDLMFVTLDENHLRSIDDPNLRDRVKLLRKRCVAIADLASQQGF